jgi:uncharacterized protein (DUF1499 family)
MHKSALSLFTFLIILAVLSMSCSSTVKQPHGITNGQLASCPDSPNCVSSEVTSGAASIAPLPFSCTPEEAWLCLRSSIEAIGGSIEKDENNYLWATFRTKILRFVDDLEVRMDAPNHLIHVRSASRVGYSDFGVNRKRVEALRQRFAQEQQRLR